MADRATRQVRIYDDLAEMIGDIHDVTEQPTAALVDPILRPAIQSLHKQLQPSIKQIKAARARHAKREAIAAEHDLGGEG